MKSTHFDLKGLQIWGATNEVKTKTHKTILSLLKSIPSNLTILCPMNEFDYSSNNKKVNCRKNK